MEFQVEGVQHAPSGGKRRKWFKRPKLGCMCFGGKRDGKQDASRSKTNSNCNRQEGYQSNPLAETFSGDTPVRLRGPNTFRQPAIPLTRPQDAHADRDPVDYARAQLMKRAAQRAAASRGSPARRAQARRSGIRARGRLPRDSDDSDESSDDGVGVCFADDRGSTSQLQVEVHRRGRRSPFGMKSAGPPRRVANPWSVRRRRTTTSDEEDEEDEVEDDDESRGVSAEFLSMEESLATLETIKMNLAGQVPAEGDAAAPEVVDVHLSDDARSEQGGGASSGLRDNAGGGSSKYPSSTRASRLQEDKWSMSAHNPLFSECLRHHQQDASEAAALVERDAPTATSALPPPPPPPESTKTGKGRPSRGIASVPSQGTTSTKTKVVACGDDDVIAEGQVDALEEGAFAVEVMRKPGCDDASDSSGSSLSTTDLEEAKQRQSGNENVIVAMSAGESPLLSGAEPGFVVEGTSAPAHGEDDDASSSSLSTSDFEDAKTRLEEQRGVEVADDVHAEAAAKAAAEQVAVDEVGDKGLRASKGKEAVVEEWSGCDPMGIHSGLAGGWGGGGFAVEGEMAVHDGSESSGSLSTTDLEEEKAATLRELEREVVVFDRSEADNKAGDGCATLSDAIQRARSIEGDPPETFDSDVRVGSLPEDEPPHSNTRSWQSPARITEDAGEKGCGSVDARDGDAERAISRTGGTGGAALEGELSRGAGDLDGVHLNDSATSLAASDVGEDAEPGFSRSKHASGGVEPLEFELLGEAMQQDGEEEEEATPSVGLETKPQATASRADSSVNGTGEEPQVPADVEETSDDLQDFSGLLSQEAHEETTAPETTDSAEIELERKGTVGNVEGQHETLDRREDAFSPPVPDFDQQPELVCVEQACSEKSARDGDGRLASGSETTEDISGERGARVRIESSALQDEQRDPLCENPREQNEVSPKRREEVIAGHTDCLGEKSAPEKLEPNDYVQDIVERKDVQGSSAKLEMEVADDPESTSALPQDICTVLNAAQSSLSGVVDAEPGELLNNSLDNMQASVLDSTESSNADGQEEKLALPFLGEHGTESPKNALSMASPETPPTVPKQRAARTEEEVSPLTPSTQFSTSCTGPAATGVGRVPIDIASPPLSQKPATPARRKIFGGGALGPKEVIGRVLENDPFLSKVHLSSSAVYQMKADEYTASLAEGLRCNTRLTELNLVDCNLTDGGAEALGQALLYNSTLVLLNLEKNNIKQQGATALAKGLAQNSSLRHLNLLHQKQNNFGDATLTAFVDMFETNVTLLKISWRLDSRKSFALNKLITRNNEIDRRLKTNREFAELLPADLQINTPVLKPFYHDVA